MSKQDDLQWSVTVSKKLESLLQEISQYASSPQQHGWDSYLIRSLAAHVKIASRTARLLLDSIKSKSTRDSTDGRALTIHNPTSERELILIVEDDVDVAQYTTDVLVKEGYKVVIAYDGPEAVKIFRDFAKEIGLVILDFFLPTMEGDAVFSKVRALNPVANVLLCSGFLTQELAGSDKLKSMHAQGLRGFLPKPYTRRQLLEQVSCTLKTA